MNEWIRGSTLTSEHHLPGQWKSIKRSVQNPQGRRDTSWGTAYFLATFHRRQVDMHRSVDNIASIYHLVGSAQVISFSSARPILSNESRWRSNAEDWVSCPFSSQCNGREWVQHISDLDPCLPQLPTPDSRPPPSIKDGRPAALSVSAHQSLRQSQCHQDEDQARFLFAFLNLSPSPQVKGVPDILTDSDVSMA